MTTSLSEYMDGMDSAPLPEDEERRETWRIDSPARADWSLRILAGLRRQIADARALAAAEIARVNEWLAGEEQRLGGDASFHEAALIDWHRRQCDAALAEAGGDWRKVKTKTVRLPNGEVSAHQNPDSWPVTDAKAFVAWAKVSRPELVRVKEEPNIAEAKRVLPWRGGPDGLRAPFDPTTGEIVPGITIQPGEIAYKVETS